MTARMVMKKNRGSLHFGRQNKLIQMRIGNPKNNYN